jgi:hypothetical protein
MEENRLVERMLRANLHQRQYMQQVNAPRRPRALWAARLQWPQCSSRLPAYFSAGSAVPQVEW